MASGNFRIATVFRVLITTVFLTLFLLAVLKTNWVATSIVLFLAICLSVYELTEYIERSNRNFSDFLLSIHSHDFSKHSILDNRGKSFEGLKSAFNLIIEEFQSARIAKEEQYAFLQSVISHLSTSIICFDGSGHIKLINNATLDLLGLQSLQNIKFLESNWSELFYPLKNGDNEIVEITTKGERLKLLLRSTSFKIREVEYKLVLITNVNIEIDRTETQAWRQLLQVLTHEIMNSVTPISSLSETIKMEFDEMIRQRSFNEGELNELSEGLSVIKNRSAGLISFVHQYKSLISLPAPVLKPIAIADIFNHAQLLTVQFLQGRGIRLTIVQPMRDLIILADQHMIEQVMLNLLHNAAEAAQHVVSPHITIACEERVESIIVTVSDNGSGIDKGIEHKIFIPFFTTKATGTGVGLSLAKQIMHLHNGHIGVHFSQGTQTVFSLSFPKPSL